MLLREHHTIYPISLPRGEVIFWVMVDVIKMKLITVHLPVAYLNGIDELISHDSYPNRSEAIRVAVRDLLKSELGGFIRYEAKETIDLLNS